MVEERGASGGAECGRYATAKVTLVLGGVEVAELGRRSESRWKGELLSFREESLLRFYHTSSPWYCSLPACSRGHTPAVEQILGPARLRSPLPCSVNIGGGPCVFLVVRRAELSASSPPRSAPLGLSNKAFFLPYELA